MSRTSKHSAYSPRASSRRRLSRPMSYSYEEQEPFADEFQEDRHDSFERRLSRAQQYDGEFDVPYASYSRRSSKHRRSLRPQTPTSPGKRRRNIYAGRISWAQWTLYGLAAFFLLALIRTFQPYEQVKVYARPKVYNIDIPQPVVRFVPQAPLDPAPLEKPENTTVPDERPLIAALQGISHIVTGLHPIIVGGKAQAETLSDQRALRKLATLVKKSDIDDKNEIHKYLTAMGVDSHAASSRVGKLLLPANTFSENVHLKLEEMRTRLEGSESSEEERIIFQACRGIKREVDKFSYYEVGPALKAAKQLAEDMAKLRQYETGFIDPLVVLMRAIPTPTFTGDPPQQQQQAGATLQSNVDDENQLRKYWNAAIRTVHVYGNLVQALQDVYAAIGTCGKTEDEDENEDEARTPEDVLMLSDVVLYTNPNDLAAQSCSNRRPFSYR